MRTKPAIESLETRTLLHTVVVNPDGSEMGEIERYLPEGGLVVTAASTRPGRAVADGQPGFQITLDFSKGGLTASQQAVFAAAAARWEAIITSDLSDVGGVDDLKIAASGVAIDGVNAVLGRAGPTNVRSGYLPYLGMMEFDTADLANMEANGALTNVIVHEMGHVLGLGTIWSYKGLTQDAGTANSNYLGAAALAQYQAFTRNPLAISIPLETSGGPGTADGHWAEGTFNNELMTGYINGGNNPLSRMSAASLIDLGYSGVNLDATNAYTRANDIPVLGGLVVSSVASLPITFTVASATDGDGIEAVRFYRETNGIPGLQAAGTAARDTLMATATNGLSATSSGGLPAGSYTFYARASDDFGLVSNVSVATLPLSILTVPAAPSTPDLADIDDRGVSDTDDITNVAAPTFVGTASANSTVTLWAGTTVIGTDVASADGVWSITASPFTDGAYSLTATATNAAGNSLPSGIAGVVIDTTAPVVSSIIYDGAVTQDVQLTFDDAIAARLTVAAGTLRNETTGTVVAIDRVLISADGTSAGVQTDALLDTGDYVYSLATAALTDVAGNAVGPTTFGFRQLNGDLNDDGTVDFDDLLVVAQNYGHAGRSVAEGNLDYGADGLVGFGDLLILTQNYGVTMQSGRRSFASESLFASKRLVVESAVVDVAPPIASKSTSASGRRRPATSSPAR